MPRGLKIRAGVKSRRDWPETAGPSGSSAAKTASDR